jgi:hypothetical protein
MARRGDGQVWMTTDEALISHPLSPAKAGESGSMGYSHNPSASTPSPQKPATGGVIIPLSTRKPPG